MDRLIIKEKNGISFVYFDNEYGRKLDSYLKGGWVRYDFKKRTRGIKYTEFLDYLFNVFNNIHITSSMFKNDYYDFSFELNNIISKFNSIGFDINSIIKNHGYEDDYFINKKNVIENYYNNCITNFDGNSLLNLIEFVNELYNLQVKVFKTRDLFILKDDLMDNLKDVCSIDVYNHYNNLYVSYLNEDVLNLEKMENLFLEIQNIILDDWKNNMSSIDGYKLGSPFKFVCHSVSNSNWSGDYQGKFVSASLLTEQHNTTYNKPYGFIMNPNDIIMTSSEDLFIRNNSDDLDNIYLSGVLPTVKSLKNVTNNTIYYNEVVLDGFNPIGIFCVTDGSKELNPYYIEALNLKNNFPNLPIIDLDISFFDSKIDTILSRNALVDTIEEKIGIFNSRNSSYYDYFSYFWDSFMSLKQSNYTSQDIINLFRKYYDLIYMDLDEILNSSFDDDFVVKLIGANYRYSTVNRILSNNFDSDDIKSFYEIYSNLNSSSYNRLDKLFPNFNMFLNLLDEYLISNEYDIDSFIALGKLKNFDELISYLNGFSSVDSCDNLLDFYNERRI